VKRKVRVLIVDDNRSARQGLKALLAHWPEMVVVNEAVNGQQAVQMLGAYQPDVVLMDLQMPVLDGFTATRQIKAQGSDVRVIALTTYGIFKDRAYAAGADDFLIKGCGSAALYDGIMRQFEHHSFQIDE